MSSSIPLMTPGSNDVIKTATKTSSINSDNKLYKTMTVKSKETTLSLNNIELLSSDNIAPDFGSDCNKIWEISYSYNDSTKKIESTVFTADPDATKAQLAQLNDKKIGLTDNLKILRPAQSGNVYYGIGVGYEFSNTETISAISLKIGESPEDLKEPYVGTEVEYTDFPKINENKNEWVSIYYKDALSHNWKKLAASEYIECVSDNSSDTFTFYPATSNRNPGYGIWNSEHFGNSDSDITTSYLVFKYQIQCEGIMFVERSGNDFLDVAEMGVYNEDPLKLFEYTNSMIETAPSTLADVKLCSNTSGSIDDDIFINGNPSSNYSLTATDVPGIEISLSKYVPQSESHFVFWQQSGSRIVEIENGGGITLGYGSEDDELFTAWDPIELNNSDVADGVADIFDTPFFNFKVQLEDPTSYNELIPGNPIPYVPDGVDSPRTFAYKMNNQLETWNSVTGDEKSTLLAEYYQGMVSYQMGYVDEKTADGTGKPFLPGYYKLNGTGGYDDESKTYAVLPEKVAGVDSAGIAQGALSALKADYSLKNIKGQDLLTPIDTYYAMSSANSYGLDSTGKPIYQRTDTNSYDDITRLTPADIEKNTVIVPDVRLSQAGDLLVKTEADGNLHIGVIVGYRNTPTSTTATLSDWMKSVLVVSTRAGFRMSNLGVWGNSNGMFGGFSEEPEQYIIRRWLLPAASLAETGIDDAFPDEVINTLHFQRYTQYVEEGKVAWEAVNPSVLNGYNTNFTEVDGDDYKKYANFMDASERFYRELPPTSYSSNVLTNTLFKDGSGEFLNMRLNCYTGWRDLGSIKYHRGLDCNPDGLSFSSAETDEPFYAPESGKFWVEDLGEGIEATDPYHKYENRNYVKIDENNALFIEGYYYTAFGDVGILVTNPDNPRKGRIYVFAHLNDSECSNIGDVEKGEQIGEIGGAPSYIAHIHIEVYEYFPEYVSNLDDENVKKIFDMYIEKHSGDTFFINTEESKNDDYNKIRNNLGWQRIDPRTVFEQSLMFDNTNDPPDETSELISTLQSLPAPYEDHRLGTSETDINEKFLPWNYWVKITEE